MRLRQRMIDGHLLVGADILNGPGGDHDGMFGEEALTTVSEK